ncbi:MAG: metallophosphoesterase [Spirochaetes bacterium]|nr:metallophosphoesterase [Spirochaetota bacterium]
MKVLCVSDHIDPVVYSNNIKTRFRDVDIIISAGDLPLNYYDFIVSNLNKPLFFVFGNHNLKHLKYYKPQYQRAYYDMLDLEKHRSFGATFISGKVRRVKKGTLILAGLGGSMLYNGGANQYSEFGMALYAMRLIPRLIFNRIFYGRYLDILVTHAPPAGIHDLPDRCHRGFKVFLWLIKYFKPRYLIHGHVHLYDRNANKITKYLDTYVVNAYNHCLIDSEGGIE